MIVGHNIVFCRSTQLHPCSVNIVHITVICTDTLHAPSHCAVVLRHPAQAPMSPRAMLPSMSPSQRRVGFDVNSTLPSYAVDDGEGSFSETTLEGQHMVSAKL